MGRFRTPGEVTSVSLESDDLGVRFRTSPDSDDLGVRFRTLDGIACTSPKSDDLGVRFRSIGSE